MYQLLYIPFCAVETTPCSVGVIIGVIGNIGNTSWKVVVCTILCPVFVDVVKRGISNFPFPWPSSWAKVEVIEADLCDASVVPAINAGSD